MAQTEVAQPAPEETVADVAYGGYWARVAAMAIDLVIGGVLIGLVGYVSSGTLVLAIGYVVVLVYFGLCWGRFGRTIGMLPFGLRVVRSSDGERPTWRNAVLRLVGWVVSWLVIFPICFGFLWPALDSRKRCWHDILGGTVVVKDW
jgi:uncharacterized RDD family membrane protein YckC